MSRTVSYPPQAIAVAYQSPFENTNDEYDLWEDYKDGLRYQLKELFPSLTDCSKWLGSEDLCIMENGHCHVGISEYMGLVSIWIVPKTNNGLTKNWCYGIKDKFMNNFNQYNKVATFSNGEARFEKIELKSCVV